MPKTVSVHNGSAANREHNRRNPRTTGQMPHIQQDLVHHNETWIDIPVREAYKQIFQTAVDDYNRRQSRPERKIRVSCFLLQRLPAQLLCFPVP